MKTLSTLLALNCILFSSCAVASDEDSSSGLERQIENFENDSRLMLLKSDQREILLPTPQASQTSNYSLSPRNMPMYITTVRQQKSRKRSYSFSIDAQTSTSLDDRFFSAESRVKSVSLAQDYRTSDWEEKKEAPNISKQQFTIKEFLPDGDVRRYEVPQGYLPFVLKINKASYPTSDSKTPPIQSPFLRDDKKRVGMIALPSPRGTMRINSNVTAEEYKSSISQDSPFSRDDKKRVEMIALSSPRGMMRINSNVTAEEYKSSTPQGSPFFHDDQKRMGRSVLPSPLGARINSNVTAEEHESSVKFSEERNILEVVYEDPYREELAAPIFPNKSPRYIPPMSLNLLDKDHKDLCKWSNLKAIAPAVKRTEISTGDLLSFVGEGIVSGCIRCCLGKRDNPLGISHVAMVIVASVQEIRHITGHCYQQGTLNSSSKKEEIMKYLDECFRKKPSYRLEEEKPRGFLIHSTGQYGVHIAPLDDCLQSYRGKVFLRHLEKPVPLSDLIPAIIRDLGKGYNSNPLQMTRAINDKNSNFLDRSMFCSQLVADLYLSVNLLLEETLPINITPVQFTSTHRSDVLKDLAGEEIALKFP